MTYTKKDWLRDLRSGEYEQTKFFLRREDDGYCCLGVYCEASAKLAGGILDDFWVAADQADGDMDAADHNAFYCPDADSYTTLNGDLEHEFFAMLGIPYDDEDPDRWMEVQQKLQNLNDGNNGEAHSFEQIADWVEHGGLDNFLEQRKAELNR